MTEELSRRAVGEKAANRDAVLAQRLVSLADTLVDDYDVVDLLDELVTSSVELLDVVAAGLLLIDQRGSLRVVASSSQQIRLLELLQVQSDEGPCLDCVRAGAPVVVEDLRASVHRWPTFGQAAVGAGFHSVLALPMRLRAEKLGGLNLFGARPGVLGADDQRIAQALADMATIGILQQRSIHRGSVVAEQLHMALSTRIIVEQAKGVMAEHGGLKVDEAYAALRAYSRSHNRRLSEVASEITAGALSPGDIVTTPEKRR